MSEDRCPTGVRLLPALPQQHPSCVEVHFVRRSLRGNFLCNPPPCQHLLLQTDCLQFFAKFLHYGKQILQALVSLFTVTIISQRPQSLLLCCVAPCPALLSCTARMTCTTFRALMCASRALLGATISTTRSWTMSPSVLTALTVQHITTSAAKYKAFLTLLPPRSEAGDPTT